MIPERIQRKRTKGWRMPANTINVTRPGPWGNPFVVGKPVIYEGHLFQVRNANHAVHLFLVHVIQKQGLHERIKSVFRKKNIACWCKPGTPCHGDLIFKIANGIRSELELKLEEYIEQKLNDKSD